MNKEREVTLKWLRKLNRDLKAGNPIASHPNIAAAKRHHIDEPKLKET